jgi:hypothetical protein
MLTVPNELLRRARASLVGDRKSCLQAYLLDALEALAVEKEPLDKETEAKLIEGLDSPVMKMTDVDWRDLLRRAQRRGKR